MFLFQATTDVTTIPFAPTVVLSLLVLLVGVVAFLVRIEGQVKSMRRSASEAKQEHRELCDRVKEIELDLASHDPDRRRRMHVLSRAREEREEDDV